MSAQRWSPSAALFVSGLALTILALSVRPLSAQERTLTLGVAGGHSAHNEVDPANRQSGFGAAATARYYAGRWAVDGEVTWRSLSPTEDEANEAFSAIGGALRGQYAVWREVAVELGFESRTADPEFAAQDVAVVLTGLRYELPLSSLSSIWIRGAAIPVSWFNGGGESGIGMAVGFGVRLRPGSGPWGAFADYDFQRIDRTVQGLDVPIQLEGVRLGITYDLF